MVVISHDVYVILGWFIISNIIHFTAPIYKWHSSTRQSFQFCMAINYLAITLAIALIGIGGIYVTIAVAGLFVATIVYMNFH